MISGGLDSAVLLYLILKEFQYAQLEVKLQPFTIPKKDGSQQHVLIVLDYMNREFGISLPDPIPVGDISLHHSKQGPSAVAEIKSHYPTISQLFFGSNRVPPLSAGILGTEPKRIKTLDPLIVMPFFDMYKTDIIEIAIKNNLQDLFNITHSCTEQQLNRCNQCWQCNERKWAFLQLSLEDTGTN